MTGSRRTTTARLGGGLATLLLVGACGGPSFEPYAKSTACGVETDTVAAVVGTDEFRTDERGNRPLPDDAVSAARWTCDVDLADRDDVVSATGRIGSAEDIAERTRFVDSAPEQLEIAGGRAGIETDGDSFTAQWVCGSTAVSVTASPSEKSSARDRAQLVTGLAEAVGCLE
jgi:hypothetical protein